MGRGMGQGFLRILGAPTGSCIQSPAQKYCPKVWVPKGHRGHETGGARVCEGPHGAHGELRTELCPRIVPEGWGAKRPQGPRDECAIALVEGAGAFRPRDSEWGRICDRPQGTWGEARTDPRPKIMPACRGAKGPRGPETGGL